MISESQHFKGIDAQNIDFVQGFERQNGRKLRVLHVGNIAGNGFLNAKFERQLGLDSYVLCRDYYHSMACPEWEDAAVVNVGDDNMPIFKYRDGETFQRPDWFVQGPTIPAIKFLQLSLTGEKPSTQSLLQKMIVVRMSRTPGNWKTLSLVYLTSDWKAALVRFAAQANNLDPVWRQSVNGAARPLVTLGLLILRIGFLSVRIFSTVLRRIGSGLRILTKLLINPKMIFPWLWHYSKFRGWNKLVKLFSPFTISESDYQKWRNKPGNEGLLTNNASSVLAVLQPTNSGIDLSKPLAAFAQAFPARSDQLSAGDLLPYQSDIAFDPLFDLFDVIQFYATDVKVPITCRRNGFTAFEHGTLRHFTTDDDPLHRLTALGFRAATRAFITNSDCLAYAKDLGMENWAPMIHPINVEQHRKIPDNVDALRASFDADVLILAPARHDWFIKGNDKMFEGLALLKSELDKHDKSVKLITANWGADIDQSKELAASLGIEENIAWVPSMCRVDLIAHTHACDLVFDQFILPAIGSSAPQAIATGTPVVSSYDPVVSEWLFDEPVPILSAQTASEICARTLQSLDENYRTKFKRISRQWIDNHHGVDRLLNANLTAYKDVVEEREGLPN